MATTGLIARAGAALLAAAALGLAVAGCGGDDTATPQPPTATTTATTTTGTATTTVSTAETLAESVAAVRAQLAGIRQAGLLLGDPRAPVTIIEYGGFDCPPCASAHEQVVPELIERYVRTGKANLELRLLAAGESDLSLALAVHAARPQSRGWQMTQLLYRRASAAPANPLVEAESATGYARALGLDVPRWKRDAERPTWASQLQAALTVFKLAKWGATPVFLVRRAGLDVPFEVVSAPTGIGEIDAAFTAALGR